MPDSAAHRWWGLDRRQTALALVGAALIGALIVWVANLAATGDGAAPARPEVWVFGTRTVAAPPSLLGTRPVAGTGFGSVVGAPGKVWMYEAVTGQLGRYRSATSRIERLGHVPRGRARASTALPLLAPVGRDLWLTPTAGELVRYEIEGERVTRRVTVDAGAADGGVSAVVATRAAVVTAVQGPAQDPGGVRVYAVDPASGRVRASADLARLGALHGLAAARDSVWVVGDASAVRLDLTSLRTATSLRVVTEVALQPGDGALGGAVVSDHDLFILRGADQLLRIGHDGTVRVVSQLRGTGNWPAARNASLVAGAGQVYALVPVGTTTDDESTRLLGYDAVRGRATRALEFSSAFFAGGLAFSSK